MRENERQRESERKSEWENDEYIYIYEWMLVERHTQGGKREKQRVEESDREAERGREREW